MQWLEVTINTDHERLEELVAKLTMLDVQGIITEDEGETLEFLEDNRKYWDYVDEDFLKAQKGITRAKFYLEDSNFGKKQLLELSENLPGYELMTKHVKDEDWENNWKEFYKPLEIGDRLLVVPQWEKAPENTGKTILHLDPGLIFGTGNHATTQLCLEELQNISLEGKSILDLGCGSGILAIAGLLLGAKKAVGVDIDDKAPKVVMENAELNGIGNDRLTALAGDVLNDTESLQGETFDIVLANIVADVIIALSDKVSEFMAPGGVFICSGIIEGRENEVKDALIRAGLDIKACHEKDGWYEFYTGVIVSERT